MSQSPADRRVFYDCILESLAPATPQAASAARAVRAGATPTPASASRLRRLLDDPSTRAIFAAIRARRAGPVIGHLRGARIFDYITGADGSRWHFDGPVYPGRELTEQHIVAANSAVYTRLA